MKKEIVDFYANKGLHISKMINRRPMDIAPEQIEAAAELVYKDIQAGRQLKNIQIASEVFRVAKDINGEKYAQEKAIVEDANKIIDELKRHIEELTKAKDMNAHKYAEERTIVEDAKKIISEMKIESKKNADTIKKVFAMIQRKDVINKTLETKNKRLKVYLIITLGIVLISEFILLLPYIESLLKGLLSWNV